ncbi:MAG: 5,10-methylenetetrahydromethanopterin reductase [Acidimicrobiales bacterium]|jgi:5,10-methylenetetrahydromethanopterin reductase
MSRFPVTAFEEYVTDVQTYLRGDAVNIDGYESRNTWIAATGLAKVPVDVAATGPRVIALSAVRAERITFAMGADPQRVGDAIALAKQTREAAGLDPNLLSLGAYVNCTADPDVELARATIAGTVGVFAHFSGMAGSSSSPHPAMLIWQWLPNPTNA